MLKNAMTVESRVLIHYFSKVPRGGMHTNGPKVWQLEMAIKNLDDIASGWSIWKLNCKSNTKLEDHQLSWTHLQSPHLCLNPKSCYVHQTTTKAVLFFAHTSSPHRSQQTLLWEDTICKQEHAEWHFHWRIAMLVLAWTKLISPFKRGSGKLTSLLWNNQEIPICVGKCTPVHRHVRSIPTQSRNNLSISTKCIQILRAMFVECGNMVKTRKTSLSEQNVIRY